MKKKMAIIGTDPRLSFLQQSVSDYLDAQLYPTMTWDKELRETIFVYEPDVVFLPIQPIQTIDCSLELPPSCQTLFIGKANESIDRESEKDTIQSFYYLEDEEWIWENANLTAEGFINYFYLHEKQAIYNKQFIITGYGRVGKRLALALLHLGADVIISVRSELQLYEAKSSGYQIVTLDHVLDVQNDSAYLVNTIPTKWLKNEFASHFNQVFDLASNPGCLLDNENNIPLNYSLSTSLPGMYFPQDAGQLLARSVLKHLAF